MTIVQVAILPQSGQALVLNRSMENVASSPVSEITPADVPLSYASATSAATCVYACVGEANLNIDPWWGS